MTRDFKPPDYPPSHTGTMWLNKDGSVGAIISDVFNSPLHLVAIKKGTEYHVQGWRGEAPEFLRIPLVDDSHLEDGRPTKACIKCQGRLFWRASIVSNPNGGGVWRCATCEPYPDDLWIDGVAIP
jgi:hypothetical protein